MANTFLQARLTAIENMIVSYETALASLDNGVQSYSLDTGQSVQKVTKFDIKDLNDVLNSLYNQQTVLYNRLNGKGTLIGRPSW